MSHRSVKLSLSHVLIRFYYDLFIMYPILIYLLVRFLYSARADPINPDIEIKNCTFGEICPGAINSSTVHYYSVEYSFDPSMVRLHLFLSIDLFIAHFPPF